MRHSLALVALAVALCLTGCSTYHGPIDNSQSCYGGPSTTGRFSGSPDTNC